MKTFWIVSLSLYLLVVAILLYGMAAARSRLNETYGSEKSQRAWEDWRESVLHGQERDGPVERSVPESAEPPTLVLLRDHFAVSVLGAVAISSALYWSLAFFIRGALLGPKFQVDLSPADPPDATRAKSSG